MHTTTTIAAQITRPRTFSLQLHTIRVLWLHLHGVLKASTSVPRSLPVGCQANSAGRAAAVQTRTGPNQERVWLVNQQPYPANFVNSFAENWHVLLVQPLGTR